MNVQLVFKDAWNTGRQYSSNGQRIAVYEVVVDGKVVALLMFDLDRHLDYLYAVPPEGASLRRHILWLYDRNLDVDCWDQPWYGAIQGHVCGARRDAAGREFPTWGY